ncbi:TPA: dTMP kinase [Candidatus Peregrinibacteria bacterium]|nr:dTMP kinase [Candidatus Peregrinibacteria bacterium]HIQ57239.1 dTMP kinase [Candidatus Gracilibacteria bacterium]
MFIVFEGPDGSGTSTQAKILAKNLEKKGLKVFTTAEPSKNILGKVLREALQKKYELSPKAFQLLFFADREQHVQNEVLPALARGEIVICERYNWSSIAFGVSEKVERKFLENLSSRFIEPDHTFFMNISAEKSLERVVLRGEKLEHFETSEKLKIVQEVMLNLAEQSAFTKRSTILNATDSIETIAQNIEMILTPMLFLQNIK